MVNYILRIRSTGLACLSSLVCTHCYVKGGRVPFMGVELTGGTTLGSKPKDKAFQKEIWQAMVKHYRNEHGMEFVRGAGGCYQGKRIK
jgi:hypothetical protein